VIVKQFLAFILIAFTISHDFKLFPVLLSSCYARILFIKVSSDDWYVKNEFLMLTCALTVVSHSASLLIRYIY